MGHHDWHITENRSKNYRQPRMSVLAKNFFTVCFAFWVLFPALVLGYFPGTPAPSCPRLYLPMWPPNSNGGRRVPRNTTRPGQPPAVRSLHGRTLHALHARHLSTRHSGTIPHTVLSRGSTPKPTQRRHRLRDDTRKALTRAGSLWEQREVRIQFAWVPGATGTSSYSRCKGQTSSTAVCCTAGDAAVLKTLGPLWMLGTRVPKCGCNRLGAECPVTLGVLGV